MMVRFYALAEIICIFVQPPVDLRHFFNCMFSLSDNLHKVLT